jgi:hypothetical protein
MTHPKRPRDPTTSSPNRSSISASGQCAAWPFPESRKPRWCVRLLQAVRCRGQSAPSQGSGSVTCPEAGLELDVQFGQGLPRRECIGEESDEFRVTATCR